MKLEYRLKNNMLGLLNTLLDKEIDEETKKSRGSFRTSTFRHN